MDFIEQYWTGEPTVDGFYWLNYLGDGNNPVVVRYDTKRNTLKFPGWEFGITPEAGWRFLGPLPQPQIEPGIG